MSAERASSLCGVGVSLVSVPRFARARSRWGARLLDRLFSPEELAYAGRKRHSDRILASRFAAKCAGRSALRARKIHGLRLRDLEVGRRPSGEPLLGLAARPEALRPALSITLSLSHDAEFALASVWVESLG